MDETKKGFIQLHLSVLLAGFTGLFGRLITLNEVDIVWYRCFYDLLVSRGGGIPHFGCGALLGLTGFCFMEA